MNHFFAYKWEITIVMSQRGKNKIKIYEFKKCITIFGQSAE